MRTAVGEGGRGGRGVYMEVRGAALASGQWWPKEGRRLLWLLPRTQRVAKAGERSIYGGEGRRHRWWLEEGRRSFGRRGKEVGESLGTSHFSVLTSTTVRPSSLCGATFRRARLCMLVGCKPSVRYQSDCRERCDGLKF
jgi:hypothetical protein